MGVQDRDWWRDAQKARGKRRASLDRELEKIGNSLRR